MFEKEIADLRQIIEKNTIANAESIALRHVLESNIPLNVKNFFKAEVEWLLFEEKKKEQHSSHFNYGHEDIQLLQEQMDMLLVFHYTFDRKNFSASLDRCAHFLFNYLCRPQWTLENFLFEDSDSITIENLKRKFAFCTDYRYYWSILDQYCHAKNITDIVKSDMIHLIKKIDNEIVRSHSAAELAKMTEPFFNFVAYIQSSIGQNKEPSLPTKSLVYFFDDKHISSVTQHLLKLRDFGKTRIEYQELVQELKDSFVKKDFSVEEEISKLNGAFDLPKIQLSENEKHRIIKELFHGEESRFTSILANILSSTTWDDAALALDHYFTMNDIDPFSREAIIFTNSLQSYFSTQQSKDETI